MLKISYFKNFLTTSSLKSLNMSHIIYKIPRMTVVSKETVLKMKEKLSSPEPFNVKFYEEVVNMFPRSNSGSVTMNKELFYKGVKEAKSEADIEFMLNVIADYMGNHCALSGNNLDDFLKKAIELNCPNKVTPLLKNHRQLLYYPDPNLILNIIKLHFKNKDWQSMKAFYNAIGRKYYIKKLNPLYDIYIEMAFANKDYDECFNSFLDILDYKENQLQSQTFNKIIYSNKVLMKDSIFIQIFEKAITYSKIENYGVFFALMIYNHKNKNEDKLNHYLQKLEHFNLNLQQISGVEVHEGEFVKEFLEEITTKPEENSKIFAKIKDIVTRTPRTLFSETYNEKIGKILE